jgi:hypothetical protein
MPGEHGDADTKRHDVEVWFDIRLATMARRIAARKGISQAEYPSEAARDQINRDYARLMKEALESEQARDKAAPETRSPTTPDAEPPTPPGS